MREEKEDPVVEEVRRVRARLDREANYDLKTLAERAAEFARQAGFAVCNLAPRRPFAMVE